MQVSCPFVFAICVVSVHEQRLSDVEISAPASVLHVHDSSPPVVVQLVQVFA